MLEVQFYNRALRQVNGFIGIHQNPNLFRWADEAGNELKQGFLRLDQLVLKQVRLLQTLNDRVSCSMVSLKSVLQQVLLLEFHIFECEELAQV